MSLMNLFLPLLAVILLMAPLYFVATKKASIKQKKVRLFLQIGTFFAVFLFMMVIHVNDIAVSAEESRGTATAITGTLAQGLGFLAAALC
ncbi:MAG: ATPase, partial [Erysipelotrichaceae bacterium]